MSIEPNAPEDTSRTSPRPRPVVDCSPDDNKSRTKQSFAKEANINVIMARYQVTGHLPEVAAKIPQYGDFSNVVDYQSALHQIALAEEAFMSLPAAVRTMSKNDPGLFMAFVTDPANRDQMLELGLLENKDSPIPTDEPPLAAGVPPHRHESDTGGTTPTD